MPNPVRVRTSSGWQDMAVQGAAGAPGTGTELLVSERTTGFTGLGGVLTLAPYTFDGGKYWIEAWASRLYGSATSGGGGGLSMDVYLRSVVGGTPTNLVTWASLGPGGTQLGYWYVKHRIQPASGLATLEWYHQHGGPTPGGVDASATLPAWMRLSR